MMLVLCWMEKGENRKMQRTIDDTLKQYIATSIYTYTHFIPPLPQVHTPFEDPELL